MKYLILSILLVPNYMAHSDAGLKLSTKREFYEFLIAREAVRQGIDPKLAKAVVFVESNYNPKARGTRGEVGLFQILPTHRIPGDRYVYGNIQAGIAELIYWKEHCPSQEGQETFVICYNGGFRHPKYPFLNSYYKRVVAAMGTL